ncbi:MAG TPA: tRNA lysidine(34) synthetase TilS [Allosphingosinicella sp.]|jgi:tRNA(Ile)-lysidine synthase
MEPSPPAHRVERFRCALAGLWSNADGRIGIAVSGGPDSLSLLLLADAALPGRIEAATVDHRLRPGSAAEAEFVARICERRTVPHRTLTVETPPEGSVQAAARALRYRLLAQWAQERGLCAIATAHHADDQAETLLMRLLRGSGLGGLAGIRAVHSAGGVPVVRPLLAWRRAELEEVAKAAEIAPISDPSNDDERYDRSRIRRRLRENPWLSPEPLARSAAALAEAEAALEWSVDRVWGERVRRNGSGYDLDARALPQELRRRLALRILAALGAEAPRGEALQRLLGALAAGGTATLAGVKGMGGETWRFEPAPPRRASAQPE